jgi:Tol biopolymer transport system component
MKSLRVSIPLFLLVTALLIPASVSIAQEITTFDGQIAYVGTDNNIWILRGENGENVRVTNDSNEQIKYLSPRYSPDGTMLAYCQTVYGEQTTHNLFITRVGEWQPILITNDLLCQHWAKRSFDWSPDSTKIIYNLPSNLSAETRKWESFHGIWLVDVTTGESSEVIPPPAENPLTNPHWSPDGNWIKFYEISLYSGLNSLMTGENQTGTIYNWLGAGSVWVGASDWSPDSSEIVFDEVPYTGYSGAGLYLASPKGENIRRIYTRDGYSAQQPRWSPNGSTIAFLSKPYSGGSWALMLVNPDGSDPREAYTNENRVVPVVWSPSGDKILFGTRTGDSIELVIHDLNDSSNHSIGVAGAWEADWSLAVMDTGEAQEEIVIPDFPYSESLMIYVAPDHRLVLYDPNDGSEIDLTEPLVVSSFFPSPSGRQFVYGRHLVSLDFQENGELHIKETSLPASPSGERINWSQDEQRLSFMDWRGKFWIADINGDAQQIPEATSIPIWSSDSALISFCVDEDNLRVIGGEIEATDIAENINCEIQWSPSKNILAFTKPGSSDSGTSKAFLYDTTTGETTQLLEQGEVDSWSPDGKFLAIKSNFDSTNPNMDSEIIITTPDGDRMLHVAEYQDKGTALSEWTLTDSGYLYGPYAIASDLSSATPIADSLLASSKRGGQLLVSNSELHLEVLACRDSATGDQVRLLTVDLKEIPEESLPGIWGWISPDGSRVINHSYIESNFTNLLLSCDGEVQSNLPFAEFPDTASFSEDSNWFVVTLNRNGDRGHILLSNLEEGGIERLGNYPGSNFTWLRSMELAGIHTVSGRVTTDEDQPLAEVSVFVDGILITTTDASGFFTITRLKPGEHKIELRRPDFIFSPPSYGITVPPDIDDVNFEASSGDSRTKPAPTSELDPATDSSDTTPSVPPEVSGVEGVIGTISPYIELIFSLAKDLIKGIAIFSAGTILSLVESNTNRLLTGLVLLALFILGIYFFVYRPYRHRALSSLAEPAAPFTPAPEIATDTSGETATVPQPATLQPMPEPEVQVTEPAPATVPAVITEEQIKEQMVLGTTLVRDGKYKAGYKVFRQVVQQKPDEAGAWLWLGYLAAREEDWRAAERCFRLAKNYNHPNADQALEWLADQRG